MNDDSPEMAAAGRAKHPRVLPLDDTLRARLAAFRTGDGELSPSDCGALRELVADRLTDVGFDESYEPTPEGWRLEELIDQLFTG